MDKPMSTQQISLTPRYVCFGNIKSPWMKVWVTVIATGNIGAICDGKKMVANKETQK